MQAQFNFKDRKEDSNQFKIRNNIEQPSINYVLNTNEKSYKSALIYTYNTSSLNINFNSELQHLYRNFGLENHDLYKLKKLNFISKV